MGNRYKIKDNEGLFFVTFTVVGWVDIFVRNVYRDCIMDSFKYCMENKGLQVHSYVIMTSHLHAILSSKDEHDLVSTIRDLKKHTSKQLINLIKTNPKSRREWLLNKFSYEAKRTKRGKDYLFWHEGYHAKQIVTVGFLEEKLNYIHENPVESGFVSRAEDYLYSSKRDYCGEIGVLEIDML